MGALALGASALLAAVLLLRWFVGADPKALVKGLRWFGAGALLLAAVGLAVLDRVALALFAGSLAWGLFTGGVVWPWSWPYRYRTSSARRPPDDSKTRVQTEWLDMELDHASGNTTGRVLKGDFEGDLEGLTAETGRELFRDLNATDSASARLLEAYLDRRFGEAWRVSSQAPDSPTGDMTRNEALAVLGLSAGATNEDIRTAHRRLILQNHPDHGGSGYLAAKINQAKDVLLAD